MLLTKTSDIKRTNGEIQFQSDLSKCRRSLPSIKKKEEKKNTLLSIFQQVHRHS